MAKCRSCSAPIRWAITDKNGRTIPLDKEPTSVGNMILTGNVIDGKDEVHAVLGHEEIPRGTRRFTSHFATCPDAERHRR